MTLAIIVCFWVLLCIIDNLLYGYTPYEERLKYGWKRYIPMSGIVMLIIHTLKTKDNGKG